jgi:hypothetical protein
MLLTGPLQAGAAVESKAGSKPPEVKVSPLCTDPIALSNWRIRLAWARHYPHLFRLNVPKLRQLGPMRELSPGPALRPSEELRLAPALRPQVTSILQRYPSAKVAIAGHTDAKGADDYNLRLSEQRAASVKAWLVQQGGIDGRPMTTRGWGETRPVASNTYSDGSD